MPMKICGRAGYWERKPGRCTSRELKQLWSTREPIPEDSQACQRGEHQWGIILL